MTTAKRKASSETAPSASTPKKARTKNPKDSHLYTDDNPTTTLHGTGFKDAATAQRTIELVSANRSLTYQFQTINTMLHRARHHPHPTEGMRAAIDIFADWTAGYPARKAALRPFPLLSKDTVRTHLRRWDRESDGDAEGDPTAEHGGEEGESMEDAVEFARMYVALAKGKRLANTLVRVDQPGGEDWESRRYRALCGLVAEKEEGEMERPEWLWEDGRGGKPSLEHLRFILWGWSPTDRRNKEGQ